jgi:hypothetical protein
MVVATISQFQRHPIAVNAKRTESGWEIHAGIGEEKEEIVYLSDYVFRQLYFPIGEDKCDYCKHGRRHKTHIAVCDKHEMCIFSWKEGKDDDT